MPTVQVREWPSFRASNTADGYYFAYGSNMSKTQMLERCPSAHFRGVAILDGWEWIINERGFANVVQLDDDDELGGLPWSSISVAKPSQPLATTTSSASTARPDTATASGVSALTGNPEPSASTTNLGNTAGASRRSSGLRVFNVEIAPERPVVYGLIFHISDNNEMALDLKEGVPWAYTKEIIPMRIYRPELLKNHPRPSHAQFTDPSAPDFLQGEDGMGPYIRDCLVYLDRERITPCEPRDEYVLRMQRAVREGAEMGIPVEWMRENIGKHVDLEDALDEDSD